MSNNKKTHSTLSPYSSLAMKSTRALIISYLQVVRAFQSNQQAREVLATPAKINQNYQLYSHIPYYKIAVNRQQMCFRHRLIKGKRFKTKATMINHLFNWTDIYSIIIISVKRLWSEGKRRFFTQINSGNWEIVSSIAKKESKPL